MTGFTEDKDEPRGPVLPQIGKPADGVVVFHDWFPVPWAGRVVRGVIGQLEVFAAVDVLGHDVNSRDSNWAVVVRGDNSELVVLGCQVRAVWLGEIAEGDISNDEMVYVP